MTAYKAMPPVRLSIRFINFRVAYWFSLPFAYKRKRECEGRALTTLRAGAQLNDSMALKGCGGKQEFSPTVFEIYCRYDFFDKPTGRRIACPYQIIRQNRGHFVIEILFIVRSLLNVTALYMNSACWYSERSMSLPRSTLM